MPGLPGKSQTHLERKERQTQEGCTDKSYTMSDYPRVTIINPSKRGGGMFLTVKIPYFKRSEDDIFCNTSRMCACGLSISVSISEENILFKIRR